MRNIVVSMLALCIALSGCDTTTLSTPESEPSTESLGTDTPNESQPAALSTDDLFVNIAQEVEGFGGLFLDEAGRVNVYLTDPAQQNAARTALTTRFAGVLGPQVASKLSDMEVRQGEYDFLQLKQWKIRSIQVLAMSGVVLYDIDEAQNRLRIGVEDEALTDRVQTFMKDLDIPVEAVVVEKARSVVEVTDLTDKVRPLRGGLEIEYEDFITWECTFGFNATLDGVFGFVTNSHCSQIRGEADGALYFQQAGSKPSSFRRAALAVIFGETRCCAEIEFPNEDNPHGLPSRRAHPV